MQASIRVSRLLLNLAPCAAVCLVILTLPYALYPVPSARCLIILTRPRVDACIDTSPRYASAVSGSVPSSAPVLEQEPVSPSVHGRRLQRQRQRQLYPGLNRTRVLAVVAGLRVSIVRCC